MIVLGYSREPYLRLTPTGSDQNEISQITFLNQALFASVGEIVLWVVLAAMGLTIAVLVVALVRARRRPPPSAPVPTR